MMQVPTITSCRDCEHFVDEPRKVRCELYDRCKAGKSLSDKPPFFKAKA